MEGLFDSGDALLNRGLDTLCGIKRYSWFGYSYR